MTKKHDILKRLQSNYLFAVVRGTSAVQATDISEAVFKGGIKNIEVTFTTPQAHESIKELARKHANTDMVVGAGTVLDDITARMAIIAGAEFIVSPNFVPAISTVCNRYGIPYLPGCGTVTEIADAMETGVEVVKVFPGGILGPAFIKNVHGPIPQVEMMPSGGVSLENMHEWIRNGAWSVGIGSALTSKLTEKGYDSVIDISKQFVEKYNEYS
ncbi:MAG: bifunctional 2-keto-4-hydroxyglutarate aldolase/2-keto-3-deoxy-6-phosphogluconate aldolase [Alkalibacterium sp.]|nr:bifunctional 2-keto-4-hydroxyglutarate aldolase/2-keto-3-deoxy-6-phosphogluconate aldolase [Alkalibacterium sp.]